MLSSDACSSSEPKPKPPNVLIYQSDKDTTNKDFIRVKESLETCLTPERYVIYPLGDDDILHYSPWKENCRLLVIPFTDHARKYYDPITMDTSLPSRVMEEVLSYGQAGGNLLSMQTELNRLLGLLSVREVLKTARAGEHSEESLLLAYCPDGVCDVEVSMEQSSYRFSGLVPVSHDGMRDDMYLSSCSLQKTIMSSSDEAFLVPVEWNEDMMWIRQNSNQSNNSHIQSDQPPFFTLQSSHDLPSIPCVRKIALTNNGCMVLSNIDLLPILPHPLEIAPLVRLKKSVAPRGQYLTFLLRTLGLECSEEQLPDLTHTYLLCSDQVMQKYLL